MSNQTASIIVGADLPLEPVVKKLGIDKELVPSHYQNNKVIYWWNQITPKLRKISKFLGLEMTYVDTRCKQVFIGKCLSVTGLEYIVIDEIFSHKEKIFQEVKSEMQMIFGDDMEIKIEFRLVVDPTRSRSKNGPRRIDYPILGYS